MKKIPLVGKFAGTFRKSGFPRQTPPQAAADFPARTRRKLIVKYAGIHAMYYGSMVPLSGFASAFLLYRGFSNTMIGLMIAIGTIGAILAQTTVGYLVDRYDTITIRGTLMVFLSVLISLSLVLCLYPAGTTATMVLFVSILLLTLAMSPLVNALNFEFKNQGIDINFGVARASGSMMYAVLSASVGSIVMRFSAELIPWFVVFTFSGMLVFTALYRISAQEKQDLQTLLDAQGDAKITTPSARMPGFVRRNKRFVVLLLGIALVCLSNSATQIFFLQIITTKGGNSATLGIVGAINAVVEVPVLVGFVWLNRKVKCRAMLQLSMLVFTLKATGIALVTGMSGVYLVQCLNMFGFALFAPASVYYVAQTIDDSDRVKGQAYMTSSISLGGICASFLGGIILDAYGVQMMMASVVALSVVGNIIITLAIRSKKPSVQQPG